MPSFSVLWNEGFLFDASTIHPKVFFHPGLSTKSAPRMFRGAKLKDQL